MITVDGKAVGAEGSLLEACRAAGSEVPALCLGKHLSAGGHCRACLVEVDGRFVPACTTAAREGMVVRTDSEELRAYRRDLGELMLHESQPGGEAGELLRSWGADGARYGRSTPRFAPDRSHPYLRADLGRCILCRRCIRACEEIQGQLALTAHGRGASTRLYWGEGGFSHSRCVSCGACVAQCPSEALTDADRERVGKPEQTVQSTCGYCGVGCQVEIHLRGKAIARIDGSERAPNFGHLCVKGRYAHGFARHPDRLTRPLIRRGGALVPTSWDEAMAVVAEGLAVPRGRVAGLSSSRCTNEENYLFQKLFRAALGTNDVDCCARVCHAPTAAGMRAAFGTGAATNSYAELALADLVMVVGANATEAHPVVGAQIKQAVFRGAKLVVIDPRRTELAEMAEVHLQLRPGTNVPLFNSLASVLVEEELFDREFLAGRVEGFDEYRGFILRQNPERSEQVTGVPAPLVRGAARLYGSARRPLMLHGLGVTEHYQGSEGVMLLCNLALLTGAVGREGVGVNPLRGQNNVQGAADMGCQPDLLTGYLPVSDPSVRTRFESVWGRPVPQEPGRTLPEMFEAARQRELSAMFILGEDVVQTDPDSGRTRQALDALDFLVVQEIFLSETARLADVVLPGASYLEKEGTFTSGERRVQRVRKAIDPPGEGRADWEILCHLFSALGLPQAFRHPSEVMDEVARLSPSYRGISFARLEQEGLQWPVPSPDHAGTPILHRTSFPIGKGKLTRVEYLPSPQLSGAGLTLVTGRVLEHYNAGTMTRRTPNLSLVGEDFLEVHPRDAQARGLRDGDRVAIRSAQGQASARCRVTDRVAPGVVFLSFHFPSSETNAVTSAVRDRLADCPEYKVTAVEVAPDT